MATKIKNFFEIQHAKEIFHLQQIHRRQLTIAIICAVLAFMVITQLNIQKDVQNRLSAQTPAELGQIIRNMTIEKDTLSNEIQRLKLQTYEYRRAEKSQKLSSAQTAKNLQAMKIAAGIGIVQGPGVTIKIIDEQNIFAPYDLIDLLHELRASGAEAISINGKRVVARTAIYENKGIVIDSDKIISPFILNAIGNPSTLEQALIMPGGYKATISSLPGVNIEIKKAGLIKLPSGGKLQTRGK